MSYVMISEATTDQETGARKQCSGIVHRVGRRSSKSKSRQGSRPPPGGQRLVVPRYAWSSHLDTADWGTDGQVEPQQVLHPRDYPSHQADSGSS